MPLEARSSHDLFVSNTNAPRSMLKSLPLCCFFLRGGIISLIEYVSVSCQGHNQSTLGTFAVSLTALGTTEGAMPGGRRSSLMCPKNSIPYYLEFTFILYQWQDCKLDRRKSNLEAGHHATAKISKWCKASCLLRPLCCQEASLLLQQSCTDGQGTFLGEYASLWMVYLFMGSFKIVKSWVATSGGEDISLQGHFFL